MAWKLRLIVSLERLVYRHYIYISRTVHVLNKKLLFRPKKRQEHPSRSLIGIPFNEVYLYS